MIAPSPSEESRRTALAEAVEFMGAVEDIVPPQQNYIGHMDIQFAIRTSLSTHYQQPTREVIERLQQVCDGNFSRLAELELGIGQALSDSTSYGNNLRIHEVGRGELSSDIQGAIARSGLSEEQFRTRKQRETYVARFLLEVVKVFKERLEEETESRTVAAEKHPIG